MTVKKSAAKVHKKVTPPSLEEAVVKEERKPSVTQVVEVVEDEEPKTALESVAAASASKESLEEEMMEESAPPEEAVSESSVSQSPSEDKAADEKRKELVDELFQKTSASSTEVVPEISMHTKRTTNPVMLWAIGVVVACLVVGGTLLVLSGKAGSLPSIIVIPTPTPTPTAKMAPTPTPAELKRDGITIQVLNGGGVAGAATKMKKTLEDKGYTVTDTGNAPSYTYEKTVILVKASRKAYVSQLETDLKDTYTIGSSAASLEDKVSYDARVIVGKE